MLRRVLHRLGRWFSPTALILAGLCFALPFVSVACDTPGGFGRAAPGGTTTYTGLDLITGDEPTVTPDRMRPRAQWREDRLAPQPVGTIVVFLILAGTVATVVASDTRVRRAAATVFASGAVVLLIVNQALVESALTASVENQLTRQLPAGKTVRDYVHTGSGFGICLLLLATTVAVNGIGWFRVRPRRAGVPRGQPELRSLPEARGSTAPLSRDSG